MICNFFKFTKRNNSTKLPNMVDAKAVSIQIKEDCSFITPTIKVTQDIVSGVFSPDAFNYCYIPYWNRFYYITDWTYKGNVWEASLAVDVLASFRGEIGNTTAYVIRSSTDYDSNISDNAYPAKTNVQITKVNVASAWYNIAPSGGAFVVGILNYQNTNKIGAVNYYALTISQLNSLMNYLFTDNIYRASSVYDISEGLYKSMFNPFQYIVSCMWFPFDIVSFGDGTQESMKVGYWDTGINATVVKNLSQKTFVTATIPNHPQISRGNYLNYAPYTKLCLYIPPFGSIPIDTNFRNLGTYLYSGVYVDHITGQATIRVSICQDSNHLDEYNVMCEKSGMLGVPIQISQLMPDYLGSVNSITEGLSGLGQLFNGNLGGLGTLFKGCLDFNATQCPKVSTNGANGSFIETIQYPVLIVEHMTLVDENREELGRPLYKTKVINTLSGFIQCAEADHQFSGTKSETADINRYLQEGFYYE